MYNKFSYVYDNFMDNIPYDEWLENFLDIFEDNNFNPKTIADLGCGTGQLTSKLAECGYEMYGLDLSRDMVNVAKQKNIEKNQNVSYSVQNMIDFKLDKNVDCMIGTCDSFNYILDEEDLLKSFKNVNKFLNNNGMFIFDMNTEHYFKETLGECTYSDVAKDSAYIVENSYDENKKINTYILNLFLENENKSYERVLEIHKEKARDAKDVCELLKLSGFECIYILDTDTMDDVENDTDRMYFVCKKN